MEPPQQGTEPVHFDTRPLLNVVCAGMVREVSDLLGDRFYVPAEVKDEFDKSVRALERDLEGTPPDRRGPVRVRLVHRLKESGSLFQGRPFHIVRLYGEEAELATDLAKDYRELDSGEAEVLALCMKRGGIVLFDERPAHEFALSQGIKTLGTLDLLVKMIHQDVLSLNEGEERLDIVRRAEWARAPPGRLSEYVSGKRPIW